MNIKPAIYEALTPRQRVDLTIDAMYREDESEVKRLKETCELKQYRQRDLNYSGVMDRLFQMSMAVECEARDEVIGFLSADTELVENIYIQRLVNVVEAWNGFLEGMGIEKEAMLSVGAPRHHWVGLLLKNAPKPDEESVRSTIELIKSFIDA